MTTRRCGQREAVSSIALGSMIPLLAACGGSSGHIETPGPHPVPASYARCNDLAPQRGDGFVAVGSDWSGELHDYGSTATVYACVLPSVGGVVRLVTSGDGIRVQPAEQHVRDFPSGVVPFRVTVRPGHRPGSIYVHQESVGAVTGGHGPALERGTDGWKFGWDHQDPNRPSA